MALRVGQIQVAVRSPRDSLRPREFGRPCRTAVALVAGLPRACHVVDAVGTCIHAIHCVALPQHQIEVAVGVRRDGPGPIQRCPGDGRSVWCRLLLARAGPGFDHPSLQVDATDSQIPDIADEQPALRVECDAVRLAEKRAGRRSAIAGEPRDAGAGHRGDDLCTGIHTPHDVILHLAEEKVSVAVEADFVRLVERRRERGPSVSRIALLPATGDRRNDFGLQVHAANAMVADLAEVEGAVRSDHQSVWIIDLGPHGGPTVSRKPGRPGPRQSHRHRRLGRHPDQSHEQKGHYCKERAPAEQTPSSPAAPAVAE